MRSNTQADSTRFALLAAELGALFPTYTFKLPYCEQSRRRYRSTYQRFLCLHYAMRLEADPIQLNAASGCFGLLGVVTHIVLECDPMRAAVMRPVKLPVVRAIPPPPEMKDADIPPALRLDQALTKEQRQRDQEDFERGANNEYYAEWFWFPFSSQVWVNTWSTDANTANVLNYPDYLHTTFQVLGTITANMAQWLLKRINATNFRAQDQAAAFCEFRAWPP